VFLGVLIERATCSAEVSVEVGVAIHTESDFYEPLTPLGEWVVVESYGRCWRPSRIEADWRPYCNGSWQRTEDGWYWVSDEPWGWATYHYGRWDMNAKFGWFWVPQTVWAPSWVSWHEGGGYIGWAPLSPSGRVDVEVISPRAFVFVEERRFLEPIRPTTVVVNNTTIINKTVINKGPQTEVIEKVTGHKIQPVQVRELRQKDEAAVVSRQRSTAPASEKKEKQIQPPVRTEAEPIEKKATPAREPRPVERPAVTPNVPESSTQQKPATQQVRPNEESRTRPEAKPEPNREVKPEAAQAQKSEAKPEGNKQGPKEDKADKESEKRGE